jgi:hypothetical protein
MSDVTYTQASPLNLEIPCLRKNRGVTGYVLTHRTT